MARGWICAARDLRPEPTLADLLADPIIYTLMQADGVDPHDFATLVFRYAPKARAGAER